MTTRILTSAAVGAAALALIGNTFGCDDESSAVSSNWPSYGHDVRNTRYNADEATLGPDNVDKLERVWDTADTGVSPYGVTSTAAYVDGTVYFADWEGKLHAVSSEDGSGVWSTQLNKETSGPNAQVNASPFVTDDRVYIGGTVSRLYAVDRETGAKIWDPHVELGDEPNAMLWSSPVVHDGTLVIGVGSFEVFLPRDPFTFTGNLVGVDADSGDISWTSYVEQEGEERCVGCSIWGSAAIDTERGWAFVGIGQSYVLPASSLSDAVIAVDLKTGKQKWGLQFTAGDAFTASGEQGPDFDVGASVVVYDIGDEEFVGAGDKAGKFYGMNRETGKKLWERELTTGGRTGGVMASPAVADGVIYVVSNDGIEENFGSNGPGASTAFALNGKTGKVLWKTDIDDGVFGGVAIANGLMFFTTLRGDIYALDIENGDVLWNEALRGGSELSAASGVTVAGGMVFAGIGWEWAPIGSPPPGGLIAFALP